MITGACILKNRTTNNDSTPARVELESLFDSARPAFAMLSSLLAFTMVYGNPVHHADYLRVLQERALAKPQPQPEAKTSSEPVDIHAVRSEVVAFVLANSIREAAERYELTADEVRVILRSELAEVTESVQSCSRRRGQAPRNTQQHKSQVVELEAEELEAEDSEDIEEQNQSTGMPDRELKPIPEEEDDSASADAVVPVATQQNQDEVVQSEPARAPGDKSECRSDCGDKVCSAKQADATAESTESRKISSVPSDQELAAFIERNSEGAALWKEILKFQKKMRQIVDIERRRDQSDQQLDKLQLEKMERKPEVESRMEELQEELSELKQKESMRKSLSPSKQSWSELSFEEDEFGTSELPFKLEAPPKVKPQQAPRQEPGQWPEVAWPRISEIPEYPSIVAARPARTALSSRAQIYQSGHLYAEALAELTSQAPDAPMQGYGYNNELGYNQAAMGECFTPMDYNVFDAGVCTWSMDQNIEQTMVQTMESERQDQYYYDAAQHAWLPVQAETGHTLQYL